MAETVAPSAAPAPPSRAVRALTRLDRAAHRRWFLPAVGVFPLGDYLLPVLPGQLLLAGLSALHPRRWWTLALTFVTGSVLGAFLTALAVRAAGPWLREAAGRLAPEAAELARIGDLVAADGPWALALLALLPWTPRTAVVACALAGISPWTIALAALAGRPVPLVVIALVSARAPGLLRRFRGVDRALTAVAAARATGGPGPGHGTG
ncbi:VTT domain-containing protein [Streptomyces sp. JNUCC 64]